MNEKNQALSSSYTIIIDDSFNIEYFMSQLVSYNYCDITVIIRTKGATFENAIKIGEALKNHKGAVNIHIDSIAATAAKWRDYH